MADDLDIRWSGGLDSNQRPLDPQSSALPNCATTRCVARATEENITPCKSRRKHKSKISGRICGVGHIRDREHDLTVLPFKIRRIL